MPDLSQQRLVYVAPASGIGGVGDYADAFVEAVRPHFGEVVEHRHGAPGEDSVRDLVRHRRAVQDLVAAAPGRTLVHAELSGGALVPLWAAGRTPGARVSATVHDPPWPAWWAGRTRLLARHRLLNHALHFPARGLTHRLERRATRDRLLFALSRTGAESLRVAHPAAEVHAVPMLVPDRPLLRPLSERPRAVGCFGYVYRGKGFELLRDLRAELPDDVAVRVAGRSTADLPAVPGVEVLGAVEGPDEDAFFGSLRALLVPYGTRSVYGAAFPASGVVARALAYGTPVVCLDQGSLREVRDDGGGVAVAGGASELAAAALALIDDPDELDRLGARCLELRADRTPALVVEQFVAAWSGAW